MMLGPIAASVAMNWLTIATNWASLCATLATASDRLALKAFAWLATSLPLDNTVAVFATADEAAEPCHRPPTPPRACCNACPADSIVWATPPNIAVGSRSPNCPDPNVPIISTTGPIKPSGKVAKLARLDRLDSADISGGGAALGLFGSPGGCGSDGCAAGCCGFSGSPSRERTLSSG